MIEKKIIKDDWYETEIIIEKNYSTIMPDIKTAIEMTRIANRLYPAIQRIKSIAQESKEKLKNTEKIIENYPGYNLKEKEYLKYHINKIFNDLK